MHFFGARSRENLKGVHPDLVAVAHLALKKSLIDFAVIDGLRTVEQQKEYVLRGKSKTMNSRHLTGHAVDVAAVYGGKISWDYNLYEQIAKAFKDAADELGIALLWGGDWETFKDAVHFELDRKKYP